MMLNRLRDTRVQLRPPLRLSVMMWRTSRSSRQ